jgi:hypothetical protein
MRVIHFESFFLRSIFSSLSWGTLLKASARSRLSIETTLPGFARYAVYTQEVSKPIAAKIYILMLTIFSLAILDY